MTGLNDKTVVLAGPFGLLTQNLITRLTEYGADVAVVTDDVKSAQRVCQNIMDMREVSEKFGRAAAIEATFTGDKAADNNFSRSAEMFGSTDVYIDTHLFGLKIPFFADPASVDVTALFQAAFQKCQAMTAVASQFIKGRTKGRILYLLHELDMRAAEKVAATVFNDFEAYVYKLGKELSAQNTAVNALAVGVNEEYLLSRFPKTMTIQKAHQELMKTLPQSRIVDYNEISNFTAFMASPYSSGLSGQLVHLNHAL